MYNNKCKSKFFLLVNYLKQVFCTNISYTTYFVTKRLIGFFHMKKYD